MSDVMTLQQQVEQLQKELDAKNAPVEKATPVEENPSSYPFSKEQESAWQRGGATLNNTPIERAWARLSDRGIRVGSPMGESYDVSENEKGQDFQYAFARMSLDRANVNLAVEFSDARGIVGSESGL